MIFIYHCYRGAHLSSVAAALHLNILNSHSSVSDILGLEYFDKLQPQDIGVPVLAGHDENNNPVYFMGLGRGGHIFSCFASSVCDELGVEIQYRDINCLPCLRFLTRAGGFISRYRTFRRLGRYLAAMGVRKNLAKMHRLVLHAKDS